MRRTIRGTGGVLRDDLLVKILENATEIRRATGFFASSVFTVASTEWRRFFSDGGKFKVVCCPQLSENDFSAIVEGLTERERWVGKPAPSPRASERYARDLLRWGIANGRIHLRIAVLGADQQGIYHEKFGVSLTENNRQSAFIGSINETASGYTENYELTEVYTHEDAPEVVINWATKFSKLWADETPGLKILPFHRAVAAGHLTVVPTGRRPSAENDSDELVEEFGRLSEILISPAELELRDYQEEAISCWFDEGGSGIYAMATGTGKTITSLATAVRLYEETGGPLILIVVVPYLVLVDQWTETMQWFGLSPLRCCGSRDSWEEDAHAIVRLANRDRREVASFVVSNKTFAGSAFQNVVRKLECRTLFLADEVHNFGAPNLKEALSERIALRLGLSATPERHNDPEGTEAIFDYFGEPVVRFGMKDAMNTEPPALVPYRYLPVKVELTADEYGEYLELTTRIAKALGPGQNPDTLPEPAKRLLIKRARIVGAATNKLDVLAEVIEPYRDSAHTLIYCGDGSVATGVSAGKETGCFRRQIDAVVDLLGNSLEMNVASYTAETPDEERSELLSEFEAGRLQALVAIRCLDEGLDVPNVRRAFILASSSNPRQYIQRRGRVLRLAPGKRKAEIFDFFAVPPRKSDVETRRVQRSLVRKEMKRAVEFMRLATNTSEARSRLWDVLDQLGLLDAFIGGDDE